MLQSVGSQRVSHDLATEHCHHQGGRAAENTPVRSWQQDCLVEVQGRGGPWHRPLI